jgi:hypothetical protein
MMKFYFVCGMKRAKSKSEARRDGIFTTLEQGRIDRWWQAWGGARDLDGAGVLRCKANSRLVAADMVGF